MFYGRILFQSRPVASQEVLTTAGRGFYQANAFIFGKALVHCIFLVDISGYGEYASQTARQSQYIPPLRERGNDILLLAEYFLQRYARKYQKEMRGLTREAKNKLLKYAWPGNVRELQHTVERAVILGDGSLLRPENFMFQASVSRQKKEEEVLNLEQLERQAVERAMRLSEGNVTRAAEYLGITRFALYRKLEKLGL